MQNVNLHALRVFETVARLQSMTKAAELLIISQPAVSKHIRNLEEELGFRLVEAQGRGIKLTEAGQEVARLASRLIGIEKEIGHFTERFAAGLEGKVKLCATYLPANFLLPQRMAKMMSGYPDVRFSCTTANAEKAFKLLLEYEVDLAVIGGTAVEPAGVESAVLIEDEVWFVVPSGHELANQSVSLKRMLQEKFVMREQGSSMREMLLAICRVQGLRPPEIGIEMSGLQETIRTLSAGYGAGFVSALEVQEAVKRGELARVRVMETVGLYNRISAYKREGEALPPSVALFYKSLFQEI